MKNYKYWLFHHTLCFINNKLGMVLREIDPFSKSLLNIHYMQALHKELCWAYKVVSTTVCKKLQCENPVNHA
jgi:hypothetical protein